MPHHPNKTLRGTVSHIFAHRFVLQTDHDSVLADLTPKGAEHIVLQVGDSVEIEGEMKPSEVKVSRFVKDGRTTIIAHGPKHRPMHEHHQDDAKPKDAIKAARAAGFEPLGQPRRKPKHFEVLGRRGGDLIELHIELDGHIRKSKPADRHDPKWAHAIA